MPDIFNDVIAKPGADDLFALLQTSLPTRNEEEQKVSNQLYHLLAQGNPVPLQRLADSLQLPLESISQMLDSWWGVDYDDKGRVVAYWGLTLKPTQHHFVVAGNTLYTWCAWDTLFIPAILKQTANIRSTCPVTNQPVTLTVNPRGVETIDPTYAVVSFINPDIAKMKENMVQSFCHYVHFFSDREAGETWCLDHPGTFLISINEAFMLGQRIISAM